MNVQQLSRRLAARPDLPAVEGIVVRNFSGPADISLWRELIFKIFQGGTPPARMWTAEEFASQIMGQPWWSPARLWFGQTDGGQVVGTVMLVASRDRENSLPAVHWLGVLPAWRRRGVARLLMAQLERCCWDEGFGEIRLETHRHWHSAAAFYRAAGYRTTRRPSTRTSPLASKRIASG